MKLESTGDFSFRMEITQDDCKKHKINFDMIKEYTIYKQNKPLYDKVPYYYFEPPAPAKKPGLFKRIFMKNKMSSSESEQKTLESRTKMDVYFQKKFEELCAKGLPLYSKADLHRLFENEAKLTSLVKEYAASESQKEHPVFEDRGGFSYHYDITENDTIVFYVNTLMMIM